MYLIKLKSNVSWSTLFTSALILLTLIADIENFHLHMHDVNSYKSWLALIYMHG